MGTGWAAEWREDGVRGRGALALARSPVGPDLGALAGWRRDDLRRFGGSGSGKPAGDRLATRPMFGNIRYKSVM